MEDAFQQLRDMGEAIKSCSLMVVFVNEHGMREAGIDHGGLLKELLEQVITHGFNPDYGLMARTQSGDSYPAPTATRIGNGLSLLHFLGLIVGKALYEGILLDVPLAPLFVMALQGKRPQLDDLFALDKDLHRSLLQVKNYDGNVEDLGLDWTVEEEVCGERIVHALQPGGESIPVTDANKLAYAHQVADWHLTRKTGSTAAAFASGMSQVIPVLFLRLFSVSEVNELLGGGADETIDVQDMRAHTRYSGGYSASSSCVKLFWSVMASFSVEEKRALLKFVTGTSRAPLGGFAHLEPTFTICKVDCDAPLLARIGGPDVQLLISASTCFNMLKLPNYRRRSTMRAKILYAVSANAGFDLS